MTGIPELGTRVRVWPMPGRRIQEGTRPVDMMGGGRWLPVAGREVVWSEFHVEQLRAGDLLLHPPPGAPDAPGSAPGDAPAPESPPPSPPAPEPAPEPEPAPSSPSSRRR
jgi:hypothetical protein